MEENVRKLLEALVVDNKELEQLESRVDQFNIFEAIGAVRQELRHSDFLAYLLNPQENHGLRDTFVKKLLQRVVASADEVPLPVRPIDLDIWNLEQLEVTREWQNIDILLRDDTCGLIVGIENKIGTIEHSDQLNRYWQVLQDTFHGKDILGIYLTPDGDKPSNYPKFLPFDYGQIASLVGDMAESRASVLGADVHSLMLHYAQMLRRRIVSESDTAELCRQIYRKHKRALDLIYDHRPDRQAALREFLGNADQGERRSGDGFLIETIRSFWHKSVGIPQISFRRRMD